MSERRQYPCLLGWYQPESTYLVPWSCQKVLDYILVQMLGTLSCGVSSTCNSCWYHGNVLVLDIQYCSTLVLPKLRATGRVHLQGVEIKWSSKIWTSVSLCTRSTFALLPRFFTYKYFCYEYCVTRYYLKNQKSFVICIYYFLTN